jgi:hypothetical protein
MWVPFAFHALCMMGGVASLQAARRHRTAGALPPTA